MESNKEAVRRFILWIVRLILPPFHPMKYKIIAMIYGQQSTAGAWKDIKTVKK